MVALGAGTGRLEPGKMSKRMKQTSRVEVSGEIMSNARRGRREGEQGII